MLKFKTQMLQVKKKPHEKRLLHKAKHQNDSTANSKKSQIRPMTANLDAWGSLIGPHNIAPLRLNGLETMALLDTGAQISSISKLWVEDLGLPLYEF